MSKKLQAKDLINVGIFTAIYYARLSMLVMTGFIGFILLLKMSLLSMNKGSEKMGLGI